MAYKRVAYLVWLLTISPVASDRPEIKDEDRMSPDFFKQIKRRLLRKKKAVKPSCETDVFKWVDCTPKTRTDGLDGLEVKNLASNHDALMKALATTVRDKMANKTVKGMHEYDMMTDSKAKLFLYEHFDAATNHPELHKDEFIDPFLAAMKEYCKEPRPTTMACVNDNSFSDLGDLPDSRVFFHVELKQKNTTDSGKRYVETVRDAICTVRQHRPPAWASLLGTQGLDAVTDRKLWQTHLKLLNGMTWDETAYVVDETSVHLHFVFSAYDPLSMNLFTNIGTMLDSVFTEQVVSRHVMKSAF